MNAQPQTCMHCYSTTENDGVLYPVLCKDHFLAKHKELGNRTWKYQRWFSTEQDAKDRKKILEQMYPPEGYGTYVRIVPVSRWWLVCASWTSAD